MSTTTRFIAHLVASATGAANDNLFRQVFTVALAGWGMRHGLGAESNQHGALLTQLAALVFLLPFVVCAPLAGTLGDRWSRQTIARAARWFEIALVAIGSWGFATDSIPLMFIALGGLGVQSAFYAPVKLAIIPDLISARKVGSANSILQAVTIVAILGGTGLAAITDPKIATFAPASMLAIAALTLASIGVIASLWYPRLPAADPAVHLRPFAIHAPIALLRRTPGLLAPALALGGFWGLAAAGQIQITNTGVQNFHLGQAQAALLALCLSIGIIIGALLAPRFESKAFPAGLPILGALMTATILTWCGFAINANAMNVLTFKIALVVAGIGAGLWEVPLQNILLSRAPTDIRNQVMSGTSLIGAIGMLVCVAACTPLTLLGLSAPAVLALLSSVTLIIVVTVTISYRREFSAWALTRLVRLIYQVRVHGEDRVPSTGGCLIVCNHLSFADGLILGAALPRPARYVVYKTYADLPVIGWILRIAGAIPISAQHGRRALAESIDAAVQAAQAGDMVVIFPEGKITRSGQMDTFKSGMERIAKRAGVPIVPAHLHGLWGALSSRSLKRRWVPLRRIILRLGHPLPATTTAHEAQNAVRALSYHDALHRSQRDRRNLGSAFITQVKNHPRAIAIHDAGGTLSMIKLAAVAKALWPMLGIQADEKRVGIILPPGRAGSLVNVACALFGRVAVNLNHTVGPAQLQTLCDVAGIRTIISAGPYLKRIGDLNVTPRMVQVETLLPTLSTVAVVWAMVKTLVIPAQWQCRAASDDIAAIIFSSGSTGQPKGVELSHRQVLANCAAVADALHLVVGEDVILSPLPMFHSFGLVPGFWLGLVLGLRVASQPDPTDGKALGTLAEASKATFLISTPTFVRGYMRRVEPSQFANLRFAVVGAERCDASLKDQFKERYGADLLEGYGCTELCPVVACNLPTVNRDGMTETRARDGSVGRALPGIDVFTIHPETRVVLAPGSEGLLVVRSPARMRSYLDLPDLTDSVLVHDGYNTGDIGKVDSDGFIHITGRLARFAKIGGEMVPLDHIEKAVQALAHEDIEIAVAAIPDKSKGERLILLTTGEPVDATKWLESVTDLPPLWRPRSSDIFNVAEIPKLGTGKRDLAGLKKLAADITTPPTKAE